MALLFFAQLKFSEVLAEDPNIQTSQFRGIPKEEIESSFRDNRLTERIKLQDRTNDEVRDVINAKMENEVRERVKDQLREEVKEEVKDEAREEFKENLVKEILEEKEITKNEVKGANTSLKYPFGVIDLFTLRNNTHSKVNTQMITRRINMNPYFNLHLNKNVNSPGVDIYEIERLIHSFSVSVFHPTIPFQKSDFNKEIHGFKTKGDLFSILALYLQSAAALNINNSNVLVLPDEYFIDTVEQIYGDSTEIDSNKLQEFKKSLKEIRQRFFEVLNSIHMYPLFCMPSSTLQLSENRIQEGEGVFNINYSRELITISFLKENKIKRWFFHSKFSSTNFKNRFIQILKENILKTNYNSKYNILEDTKGFDSTKTNIIFVNDYDFGLFSSPPSSNTLLNIEDLKYSILPIKELIDTFLIDINTYKFRLALYDYPIINHNSIQTKNKISAGMFPQIELNMEDLRNELTEEFHKEFQQILNFIKGTEEFKNLNLIDKIPLIITPFPSNIIHSNIKFIKAQLNSIDDRDFDISYPVPSQSFEYREDEYITPEGLGSISIEKETIMIVNEINIHKSYSELIKKIRTCKYVQFLPTIKKLKEELKDNKDVSSILDIKTKGIKEMNVILTSNQEIKNDFDFFDVQLKTFNSAYKSYLNNTELCILGADVLKEYEEYIKDDYYKGEDRKRSCVSKHMEKFLVKMNGIKKQLHEMEKEVEKEQKEKSLKKKEEDKKEESIKNGEENEKNVEDGGYKKYFEKIKDVFKTTDTEDEVQSATTRDIEETANTEETLRDEKSKTSQRTQKDEKENIEEEISKLLKEINIDRSRSDL